MLRLALGAGAAFSCPPARAATAPASHGPLIMLDPGHGGHDPGAIAPDGVREKDITLATGLALRRALLATKRYRVKMTRAHDIFVPLDRRVADTVNAGADLFIALHCDHLPDADLRGASIYTLSDTASDALAASLAQDENAADPSPQSPSGVSANVASILASLETRATRLDSATLAHDIRNAFKGVVPMLPDPERSANFAVLRDPSTPSTLLEMGCLTNKLDEALLTDPARRKMLAAQITAAIDIYFQSFAGNRIAG